MEFEPRVLSVKDARLLSRCTMLPTGPALIRPCSGRVPSLPARNNGNQQRGIRNVEQMWKVEVVRRLLAAGADPIVKNSVV